MELYKRITGKKQLEVTNHLGNVMAVISDRKIPVDVYDYAAGTNNWYDFDTKTGQYVYVGAGGDEERSTAADGYIDYFIADVDVYSDYYPGGMLMPGRNDVSQGYVAAYQGQIHDDEISNTQSHYAFEYRMSDSRLVRFWSVDPLRHDYPYNSTYAFSENSTIAFIELEGLESFYAADGSVVHTGPIKDELKNELGLLTAEELQATGVIPNESKIMTIGEYKESRSQPSAGSNDPAAEKIDEMIHTAPVATFKKLDPVKEGADYKLNNGTTKNEYYDSNGKQRPVYDKAGNYIDNAASVSKSTSYVMRTISLGTGLVDLYEGALILQDVSKNGITVENSTAAAEMTGDMVAERAVLSGNPYAMAGGIAYFALKGIWYLMSLPPVQPTYESDQIIKQMKKETPADATRIGR